MQRPMQLPATKGARSPRAARKHKKLERARPVTKPMKASAADREDRGEKVAMEMLVEGKLLD